MRRAENNFASYRGEHFFLTKQRANMSHKTPLHYYDVGIFGGLSDSTQSYIFDLLSILEH